MDLSKNHNTFKFKSFILGFTLIELMITLGVISALSAGTYVGYRIYQTREQTNTAVQSSRTLATTLMSTYGKTGSFANLSTQDIIHGKLSPSNLPVSNQALKSPWGGSVTVSPAVSNEAYAITWGQVPSGTCVNMASQLNRDFSAIQINGQVATKNQTPLNIHQISQLCQSNNNTVVLTSEPVSGPSTNEKPLPADHGAVIQPILTPTTKGIASVSTINPVTNLLPNTQNLPTVLQAPTTGSKVVSTVSVVSNSLISSTPPTTALPPQTCFPSTVSTPTYSTESNSQTQACPSGYSGSITQQQTRTKTVTTTTVTSCATPWSTPTVTNTPVTTYSTWSNWVDVSNTCGLNCVVPSPQTQQISCPAGDTGSITQQRTASCPSTTGSPVWGGWVDVSNTCVAQPTGSCYTPTQTGFEAGYHGGGICNTGNNGACPVTWSAPLKNIASCVAFYSAAGITGGFINGNHVTMAQVCAYAIKQGGANIQPYVMYQGGSYDAVMIRPGFGSQAVSPFNPNTGFSCFAHVGMTCGQPCATAGGSAGYWDPNAPSAAGTHMQGACVRSMPMCN